MGCMLIAQELRKLAVLFRGWEHSTCPTNSNISKRGRTRASEMKHEKSEHMGSLSTFTVSETEGATGPLSSIHSLSPRENWMGGRRSG